MASNETTPEFGSSDTLCRLCGLADAVNDTTSCGTACSRCGEPLYVLKDPKPRSLQSVSSTNEASSLDNWWALRAGISIINSLAPETHREAIIGDLWEKYASEAAVVGSWKARSRLLKEIAASALPLIRKRLIGVITGEARGQFVDSRLAYIIDGIGKIRVILACSALLALTAFTIFFVVAMRSFVSAGSGMDVSALTEVVKQTESVLGPLESQTKSVVAVANSVVAATAAVAIVEMEAALAIKVGHSEIMLTSLVRDIARLNQDIATSGTCSANRVEELERRSLELRKQIRGLKDLAASIDRLSKDWPASQGTREKVELQRSVKTTKTTIAKLDSLVAGLCSKLHSLDLRLRDQQSPRPKEGVVPKPGAVQQPGRGPILSITGRGVKRPLE